MNAQTAISTTILKQSDLNHLPIINLDTAEEIGRVAYLWLDLDAHKVDSITCKAGLLGRTTHTFKWSQIEIIGKDSLMVSLSKNLGSAKHDDATADILGHELWTDAGNQAGVIDDYLINPLNGEIIAYLFDTNGWLGTLNGQFQLLPGAITSIGSKRVIASVAAVRAAEQCSRGLSEGVNQAKSQLSELGAQLQEKGQQLGDQAKTQFTGVSGQLKEKGQQFSGEAKSQLTEVSGQIKEKGRQVSTTVKKRASEAQTLLHRPTETDALPESNVSPSLAEPLSESDDVPPQF